MTQTEQQEGLPEEALDEKALKTILSNTIETIEDNKAQIFGVYETAKSEVESSRKMLEDLKFKARQTIERVDSLEVQEQQEKQQHTSRTQESFLLSHCAEDKVSILFGHIFQFRLCAIQKAFSGQSTGTDGYL